MGELQKAVYGAIRNMCERRKTPIKVKILNQLMNYI